MSSNAGPALIDVEQVDDLDGALREMVRIMKPRSHVLLYEHIEANLHWEVFQFLGKLEPVVYELVSP